MTDNKIRFRVDGLSEYNYYRQWRRLSECTLLIFINLIHGSAARSQSSYYYIDHQEAIASIVWFCKFI